ncbi:unnamed protein product [Lactuca virosa]|uniref:Uncharacterized protein n=1 Tax=Lactuca virosa TaxID=75947 RepID=A0AAU9PQW9_9ASTR|nr:unnamed protein product [Lactuca virosa]
MSVYIVSTVKMILISGWPPVASLKKVSRFTDDSLKILEERGIFICFVTSRRSSSVFGTGLTDISLTF